MASTSPTVDANFELVARVADSPSFQRSARLRDLLLYICQRSLQGRYDELREQRIGVDVFARGPDFRPNEDNIVRVEARQLRKRLDDYFATEGKAEPIIITIPKGAYVAAFEHRITLLDTIDPSETSVVPVGEAKQPVAVDAWVEPPPSRFPWAMLFFGTTLVFLSLSAWSFMRYREPAYAPVTLESSVHPNPMWSELFNKDHQTYIVCADSALVLLQDLTKRSVTLAEYVNRNYFSNPQKLPPEVETLLRILPQRQYTNISDVRLVQEILQSNDEYRGRSVVRSARNIELIDFKNGNFVLLGSKRSTPGWSYSSRR
ncbi:MAG: hypothetical protein M3Y57_09155 [Acidobacteriota bacterium]|nr:hypothetical protein [Acidobacteriota bacterium]